MKRMKLLSISFSLLLILTVPSFAAELKKVSILIDGDPTVKGGYNYVCVRSLEYAQKRYPRKISTKVFNSMGLSEEAAARLVESALRSSDMLIATSSSFTKYLEDRASDFPSVTIVSIDGNGTSKIIEANFRNEELGFLGGALAALMTKSEKSGEENGKAKIGLILGAKSEIMDDIKRGYIAGSWYVDKNITVLSEYVGDYINEEAAASIAAKMTNEGAEYILAAAGNAGLGVIKVAEKENIWVIATDTEQERLFPKVVLTSVLKRTGQVIYGLTEAYVGGKEIKNFSLGVKEECIGLTTWTRESKDNIPAAVRKQMEDIEEKLEQGLIIIK